MWWKERLCYLHAYRFPIDAPRFQHTGLRHFHFLTGPTRVYIFHRFTGVDRGCVAKGVVKEGNEGNKLTDVINRSRLQGRLS